MRVARLGPVVVMVCRSRLRDRRRPSLPETQEDLTSVLGQIPHSAFLILVYAASALSAWGAIVTSLPGRTQGTAQKA